MNIGYVPATIALAFTLGCLRPINASGADGDEIPLAFTPSQPGADTISFRTQVTDGKVSYRVLAVYIRAEGVAQSFCGIQFIAAGSAASDTEPRFYGACNFDLYASIKGLPDIACREPSAIFYHPSHGLRIVSVSRIVEELGAPSDAEMDAYLVRVAQRYGFARSWFPPGGVVRTTGEKQAAEPDI